MNTVGTDRFAAARAVADAMLYEGYVLYPYRASLAKTSSVGSSACSPRGPSATPTVPSAGLRTECLLDPGPPALAVRVRCLQLQHRQWRWPGLGEAALRPVDGLEVDGRLYVDWDEALEQVADLSVSALAALPTVVHEFDFTLPGGTDDELVRAADGAHGRPHRRRRRTGRRAGRSATPAAGRMAG